MRYLKNYLILFILIVPALSHGQEFKKYQIKHNDTPFMKIVSDDGTLELSFIDENPAKVVFTANDAEVADSVIKIFGQEYFTREGIVRTGAFVPFDDISRVEMTSTAENRLEIIFYRRKPGDNPNFKIRSGNIIGAMEDIIVDRNEFVRGSVVSFWGNAEVRDGEVSGNVITLFGNISIGDKGVVRKNIAAVDGSVELDKNATIYGMINSAGLNRTGKHLWQRWYRTGKYFSPIVKFHYNRVDGAAPYLGAKFLDEDSVLPEVRVYGG